MSLCLAFPLKQLFGVVSRICSPSAVLRGPGALAGLCCPSASLHPSQDPSPAGLRGPAPGQETGCKTNHSCNMRESTWSVWSRKPRAAGRLAPGRCQRGQGWRPWVAAAGPRSLRVQEPGLGGKAEPCAGTPCAPRREQGGGCCAGGMGWVFQLLGCFFFCAGCALCYLQHGVGTQRALPWRWGRCEKPLAGRTCHNLRAGCSFLEPVGSLMALRSARVSCAPRGTFLQLPS